MYERETGYFEITPLTTSNEGKHLRLSVTISTRSLAYSPQPITVLARISKS